MKRSFFFILTIQFMYTIKHGLPDLNNVLECQHRTPFNLNFILYMRLMYSEWQLM